MTAVATGFATQPLPDTEPGVWIGAEDFSRFAVGAGTPSVDVNGFKGLRMWPSDSGSTSIYNDPSEGNVFQQTGSNRNHMLIENFSDLFQFGEVLSRIYLDTPAASGIRNKTAPNIAVWEWANSWFFTQQYTFNNSMRLVGVGQNPAANTAEINEGDPFGGFGPGFFWLRSRISDQGGGMVRIQIHPTFSSFDNPPNVPTIWDIDEVVAWSALAPTAWGSRQGWIRVTSGPTQASVVGMSYYSFSTDPTFTTPPPLPSEVEDVPGGTLITVPTLISPPDPLQGTYVGLTGSPFEQEILAGQPEVSAIPGIISDPLAVAAWEHTYWNTQFDERQYVHQDVSGNGTHLWWGDNSLRVSLLGDAPFSGGRRAVVHGGIGGRSLGIPNTASQLNVGAAGETVRVTVNWTSALTNNVTQTICSHDESNSTRAFRFQLDLNGVPSVILTENGSTDRGGAADTNLSTVYSDWDSMWLRATFDFTADTITLETSLDGAIWSPFASVIPFGANLAGMFQPADTAPLWMGAINNGGQFPLNGGAVYYVLIEEDPGGGLATVFEQDFATFTALSTLVKSSSQGSEPGGTPEEWGLFSVRNDLGNSGHMATYDNAFMTALNDQFNVGVGEVLTVVLVTEVDWILAGGGAPGNAPIFSRKDTDLVGASGYAAVSLTADNGIRFLNSDGATQEDSGVTLVPYTQNWDLNAVVFEIDGPAGEIRMRRRPGGAPFIASYNNLGTGTAIDPFKINAYGGGLGNNEQDFLGGFVIRKIMTLGEIDTVVAFLSSGRLA